MKPRDKKRAEAQARQVARRERGDYQQLAALDKRLGAGQGAERERRRLFSTPESLTVRHA